MCCGGTKCGGLCPRAAVTYKRLRNLAIADHAAGLAGVEGNRVRIAIIVNQFPKLSETFILNHITGLLDAGYQVHIFAASPVFEPKVHPDVFRYRLLEKTSYLPFQDGRWKRLVRFPRSVLEHWGQPGVRLCLNPFRYGLGALSLKAFYGLNHFSKGHFDIVHCHYGPNGCWFLCLRDLFGARFVTSFHGYDLVRFAPWGRLAYASLFRVGDAFVANGSYTKTCLEKLGCPSHKIVQIPAILSDAEVERRRRILTCGSAQILTIARLQEAKGIQYCLRAVRLLRDMGYSLRYTVIGDGPYRKRLESLAERLRLQDIVEFTGWLDHQEVYSWYGRSDVFVLPSVRRKPDGWVETQGLVIQEAQLHGLPVAASRIGGIPESLNAGGAGLLFEPGNPSDLAGKLRSLLDDPGFARALGEAGMQYCRKKYSKALVMARLAGLYERLLENGRGRSAGSTDGGSHG